MPNKCLFIIALIIFMFNFTADISGQVDEEAKKADEFLSQWDKKDMPGCSVGAIRDGKIIYKRAVGMANLDYDIPNTTTTLFNLASASKPFTAMSIALLAQQGKLSLDDDIRKYLPEIPKYEQTVTIRHLLYHTSGIREYQALIFFAGHNPDNALSDKTVLNMLARQKNLSFQPGTKHQYSNSNYHLLGIIVGRVSGKSLREFAAENIFKPLEMKNTMYFDNRNEVVKNRASGYMVGQGNKIRARASLFDLVGGGGILTTIEDLYLWEQNFYTPKVGNKETIQLLTSGGTLNNGEKIGYSLGLFLNEYRGLRVFKHSGNMSGYRAQIVTFPEQKFTSIALCNNSAIFPRVIVEKLADIYLEKQLKPLPTTSPKTVAENLPPAIPLSEKEALRLAGTYTSNESKAVFKLTLKDGKLINNGLLKNETALIPISENRFVMIDGGSRFEVIPVFKSDRISEIKVTLNNGKPDIFVPVKPALDSPQQLAAYQGNYYSEEFDAVYKITLKDNKLIFQTGETLEAPLTASYADVFSSAGGQIFLTFTRDNQGKITGFVFDSGIDEREVKGVAFRRQ